MASTAGEDKPSCTYENGHANGVVKCSPTPGESFSNWQEEVKNGGSLRPVDLETGVNGWATPPGQSFHVRGSNYFAKKHKSASHESVFKPLGVDWLRSHCRLDHVLARHDNRVMQALQRGHANGHGLKDFILAVNLQIPGRDYHHAIFYFVLEDPIPSHSLLYRFIHEDDAFRNSRFKLINRIIKGPWIVRATVGNHAACLLGKALTCNYHKGSNYFEIDVDVSSSALANAILHLALGYVNSVSVDMAFLIEAQTEEELPERILGAVRISQIEMASAALVADPLNGATHVSAYPRVPIRESSWKRLSRSISFLGQGSKCSKETDPHAGET